MPPRKKETLQPPDVRDTGTGEEILTTWDKLPEVARRGATLTSGDSFTCVDPKTGRQITVIIKR